MKVCGRAVVGSLAVVWLSSCASFSPPRERDRDFLQRREVRSDGVVTVSAVVLSDRESDRTFGTRLARNDVQPVWIEVENRGDEELLLMQIAIDPNYYSASEAAWRSRRLLERRSREKMEYFSNQQIPTVIPPRRRVGGYIFTNHDPGVKAFTVQLIGDQESHSFNFEQSIPGLRTDFDRNTDVADIGADERKDLNVDELRRYLEALPAVALGGNRESAADPLNLVIVGDAPLVFSTFARRGWDVTEALTFGSAWRTVASTLFKSAYRTSPISPLFLFGRRQDFALQKSRGYVDERNHLRLWRAPVNYDGAAVWVGQISRDIGVKLTSRTVVTHKIDPEIDEARVYLLQDLISSGGANAVGLVEGVGESTREDPRRNFTRDPYFTDGLRLVVFLTREPTAEDEIDWIDWVWPKVGEGGVVNVGLE